jgi:response regulator RpfG family c-di-GMP phosphodiesterase
MPGSGAENARSVRPQEGRGILFNQVNTMPAPPSDVLVISPYSDDHLALSDALRDMESRLFRARSWGEGRALLQCNRISVALSEVELYDGSWKDVLHGLKALPNPPHLIVTSEIADERLWAEVLNLGGYDVIAKPFDPAEVRRIVSLAAYNWERMFQSTALAPLTATASAAAPL